MILDFHQYLLNKAKSALRERDLAGAKVWAASAVNENPESKEGWLILCGLTQPPQSWDYLQRALEIAPTDPYVLVAKAWAEQRTAELANPDRQPPESQKAEQSRSVVRDETPMIKTTNSTWAGMMVFLLAVTLLFFGWGRISVFSFSDDRRISLIDTSAINKLTDEIIAPDETQPDYTSTLSGEDLALNITPTPTVTSTLRPRPTPTTTATIIPNLYGCSMVFEFVSGPLEGRGTSFTMVDEDYFTDKGEIFAPGNNTGLIYEDQAYIILHSGFKDGRLLEPLEIEFVRKYLESWGSSGADYVLAQMEKLRGSQGVWSCDGRQILDTRVVDIIRLSHEASTRLWLEPGKVQTIVQEREGLAREWIGGMQPDDGKSLYLGFCGWGPPELTEGRSTYYRFVIRFEILD